MILVDANILVYAFSSSMVEHEPAREWLDDQLTGQAQVALPWESTTAFVRLVSNPRVFARPSSVGEAWEQVERWISLPSVWVPTPTRQHSEIVGELVRANTLRANDVPDIHLAALAISHGLKLATHDRGFGRYEGLRWMDPLAISES